MAPEDIKARRTDGTLVIRWSEGDERVYALRDLRCACPCASCVDEHTGRRVLDPAEVPEDVSVDRMELVGHYALRIHWTDGHATGIYTWEFLRGFEPFARPSVS
jgi:DUF971 family protein